MTTPSLHSAFVVGAGFSMYAGMPLQEDFTAALLGGKAKGGGPSADVVQYLRTFVNRAFDHKISAATRFWPALEDIFTSLDLSANTGHHLGPHYKPSELRTVRRALIYRIITMLRERYSDAERHCDENWQRLLDFMQRVDSSGAAFISTNWDTVVEDMLQKGQGVEGFDYGCDARCVALRSGDRKVRKQDPRQRATPVVIKMHGSVNWLYCERL